MVETNVNLCKNNKNRYVAVANNVSSLLKAFNMGLCKQLISLHYGGGVEKDKIDKFISKLKEQYYPYYQQHKNKNIQLYIDSGGYSIIAGTIQKEEIKPFIDNYFYFLKETADKQYYNYIFSLDIPLSLKLDINYYDYIYQTNKYSQEKYIETFKKNKKVKDVSIFVWHFKTSNLFEIWNKIFFDYQLYKYYDKYAIGGLVGLKAMTNSDHSPWVLMLLYIVSIVYNYNNIKNNEQKPVKLHLLGQGASFSEHITVPIFENFIKQLFNIYSDITFDSVYIVRNFTAMKQIPILEDDYTITTIEKYNILDSNKITDSYMAQYLMYKTYGNIQRYTEEFLTEPIIEELLNIRTENQALKFLNKWKKQLSKDRVLKYYIGNGVIDTILNNFYYLSKFARRYNKNPNIINDIQFLKKSIFMYLQKTLNFPEIIKRK